jgi:hypothetical protein
LKVSDENTQQLQGSRVQKLFFYRKAHKEETQRRNTKKTKDYFFVFSVQDSGCSLWLTFLPGI